MKNILTTFLVFSFLNIFSQSEGDFFNLEDYPDVDISATSFGSYKAISVKVSNFTNEKIKINFPEGGFFINKSDLEQNLVILFYDELVVDLNKSEEILIGTACANPNKKVPSKGRTNWTYSYDVKIGDLIRYYNINRPIVEIITGLEYHDTQQKRHNFLQMCVWVYYDASKDQILNFATKYIFDNNKEQAKEFVDVFYPIAATFINLYKEL